MRRVLGAQAQNGEAQVLEFTLGGHICSRWRNWLAEKQRPASIDLLSGPTELSVELCCDDVGWNAEGTKGDPQPATEIWFGKR
jgi:hypothetical protein